MPFSLLANPTLAMLIEPVPLAFVTMSIVAIAATAAASNRFNESPRMVLWLPARRRPPRACTPGYGGCIDNPHYLRYMLDASLTDFLQRATSVSTALSHPATHPFCNTADRAD
jgi:hypothetical protein